METLIETEDCCEACECYLDTPSKEDETLCVECYTDHKLYTLDY